MNITETPGQVFRNDGVAGSSPACGTIQRNIDAITREAFRALPPPDAKVSEVPVSEDFVYRFFDECKGIGDPEMQQIRGKLLAGEVMRPGTFHPRTLRVVKDMRVEDARLFETLCRFSWSIFQPTPLVYDAEGQVYQREGLNFMTLSHLDTLGLVSFAGVSGYVRKRLVGELPAAYKGQKVVLQLSETPRELPLGKVAFTEAGTQLSTLCRCEPVAGFLEYVIELWRNWGLTVTVMPAEGAVPA